MVHNLNVIVLDEREFKQWLRVMRIMLEKHRNMKNKRERVRKFKELLKGNPLGAERQIVLA